MPPTGDASILLLDVDGVLNAARLDLLEGWKRGTFNGLVLTWDPTITTACGCSTKPAGWKSSGSLQERLLVLKDRAGLAPEISALRVYDVVTWMEGKDRNIQPATAEERLSAALADGADASTT